MSPDDDDELDPETEAALLAADSFIAENATQAVSGTLSILCIGS